MENKFKVMTNEELMKCEGGGVARILIDIAKEAIKELWRDMNRPKRFIPTL